MEQLISKDILLSAGFIDMTPKWEKEYYKNNQNIDDYITLRRFTDDVDKNPGKTLKLDIDNGLTNSGRAWHLHIDNCDCETIGSADLNSIEQFNKLMEVFDSNFRLRFDEKERDTDK